MRVVILIEEDCRRVALMPESALDKAAVDALVAHKGSLSIARPSGKSEQAFLDENSAVISIYEA